MKIIFHWLNIFKSKLYLTINPFLANKIPYLQTIFFKLINLLAYFIRKLKSIVTLWIEREENHIFLNTVWTTGNIFINKLNTRPQLKNTIKLQKQIIYRTF